MQTLANYASTGLSGSHLALMNRHHGVVHPGLRSGCLPVPGLPGMNRWSRSGAEGGFGVGRFKGGLEQGSCVPGWLLTSRFAARQSVGGTLARLSWLR